MKIVLIFIGRHVVTVCVLRVVQFPAFAAISQLRLSCRRRQCLCPQTRAAAAFSCCQHAQRLVARADADGFVPRWHGGRLVAADASILRFGRRAGTPTMPPAAHMATAQMNAMLDVNVTALTRLSRAVLPAFLARHAGTLVNGGSILGLYTLPVSSVYSGTKGYVINFTLRLHCATAVWDEGGVPLPSLDQSTAMSVEDCVDAAMAGLHFGESITLPAVEEVRLCDDYENARLRTPAVTQTNQIASRYHGDTPVAWLGSGMPFVRTIVDPIRLVGYPHGHTLVTIGY